MQVETPDEPGNGTPLRTVTRAATDTSNNNVNDNSTSGVPSAQLSLVSPAVSAMNGTQERFQQTLRGAVDEATKAGETEVSIPQEMTGAAPAVIYDTAVGMYDEDIAGYHDVITAHQVAVCWYVRLCAQSKGCCACVEVFMDSACCSCCMGAAWGRKGLNKAGRRTLSKLKQRSPTAAYSVVLDPSSESVVGHVAGCFPRWRLGHVYVRGRPAALTDSAAVHVRVTSDDVQGVLPPEALLGLAQTLPFAEVLGALLNSVQGSDLAFGGPSLQQSLCDALVRGIVAHIADAAFDAVQPSNDVPSRMSNVAAWVQAKPLHKAMASARWSLEMLTSALGTLTAFADVIHSIFSGQRRRVAKYLR